MEKHGLKACLELLRGNRSPSDCLSVIVDAEYDELFSNSTEWFIEAVSQLKKINSSDSANQLLLTLCHYCQASFLSDRIDVEADLRKRIVELGDKIAEIQSQLKHQQQYAAVIYTCEAAFYLYAASLNFRILKKTRSQGLNRGQVNDGTFSLLVLAYDLANRASSFFEDKGIAPSSIEAKVMAQAERINSVNCAVSSAMLVERLRSSQFASRSAGGAENWMSKFPNVLTESQACLKRLLDVKDNSPLITSLSYSSSNAMLNSTIPSITDLLPLFDHALTKSLDILTLVWCVVHLRRLYSISSGSSHQCSDSLIVEALFKSEALKRCNHLPASLAGDFASPSADSLCQVDVVAFVLMAAARVELFLPAFDDAQGESIQAPFATNSLGNVELGSENFWLTTLQSQWWRAVTSSDGCGRVQPGQPPAPAQDPFTKFRLIQDGLFLLRLSGIDGKLSHLALPVAESLTSYVLDRYFSLIADHGYSDAKPISLAPEVRRVHNYVCKYWDGLLQFFHSNRSQPAHGHHSTRVSLGGTGAPPSRLQRFFEPLPSEFMDSMTGGSKSSEIRTRVSLLANMYLGFDAHLNGNNEACVKFMKTCSNDLLLASFIEGRAFEAMAEEAQEKNIRSSTSSGSSWVVRQLYESALASYEKAVGYNQNVMQQVQRASVVDAATTSVSRLKKILVVGKKDESSSGISVTRTVGAPSVNGDVDPSIISPMSAAVQQQQQTLALVQQQQEQSISVLNQTVSQLVPAIRDLSTAARDLADVARQLRDLERQMHESVVRLECGIQQQAQRPPSSMAAATPPITAPTAPGGITADHLLPILMDLIRERNAPQPPVVHLPPGFMAQPNALFQTVGGFNANQQLPPPLPGFEPATQFRSPCAVPQSVPPTGLAPVPAPSSAFSPLVSNAGVVTHSASTIPQQPRAPQPLPSTQPAVTGAPKLEPVKKVELTKPVPAPSNAGKEKSLADMFKPAAGSWSCNTCLVRNNEAADKCAACETPKPGATVAPTTTKPLPQISFPPPATITAKPGVTASPSAGINFGAPLFSKPTGDTSGIQFGISSSPLFGPPKTTSAPLSTTTVTPTVSASAKVAETPKPLFGFTAPAAKEEPKEDAKDGGEGEEGDSPEEFVPTAEYQPVAQLPSNYEVVTGEESEERLFSEKAKLYRWAEQSNEWKERGVGEMKILKNKDSGRARILMRREQVLKPCANHYITAEFELRTFASVGDRGWTWLAADYAEVEPGEAPQVMKLAIRFRNADQAQEFKRVVDSCKTNAPVGITKSPARGEAAVTPKPTAPAPASLPKPVEAKTTALTSTPTFAVTTTSSVTPSVVPPATTQPSGLPVPVFGSSFVKKPEGAAAAASTTNGGLFSFAALAAASAPQPEAATKPNASPFVGQPEPLFKNLLKSQPTPASAPKPTAASGDQDGADGGDDGGEGGEQPDAFVPTAEYKPVVELPSDYKHVSGEENFEKVFSERCKLYRWDSNTNEWKERGIGDIRLLKATDGSCKHRIVMRREHIHTVCANHYLTINPSMKLSRLPSAADKAVTWFTPSDYADGEAKMETLCARFRQAASADQFSATFKKAIEELQAKYGGGEANANATTNENAKPPSNNHENVQTKTQLTSASTPSAAPNNIATANPSPFSMKSIAPVADATNTNASSSFAGFRFGQLGTPTSGQKPAATTPFGGAPSGGLFGNVSAAAPGGFSFSGVFPTPSSTTASNKTGTDDDSDCQLVATTHATVEEVARARQFLLPDDFYLYRLRKPCAGCPGCFEDDNNENLTSTAKNSANSFDNNSRLNAATGASQITAANTYKPQVSGANFSSR